MDNHLVHFGILGMHWGVRRTPEELGHAPKSTDGSRLKKARDALKEKRTQNLVNKAAKTKTDISSLSDDDLNKLVNRLQLEKRYNELMAELHPDKNHAVMEFVKNASLTALKNISKNSVEAITKYFDSTYKNTKELEKLQTLEGIEVSKYNAELAKARLAAIKSGTLDATKAQPFSGKGKKNS